MYIVTVKKLSKNVEQLKLNTFPNFERPSKIVLWELFFWPAERLC
jgi:hypothetical protein